MNLVINHKKQPQQPQQGQPKHKVEQTYPMDSTASVHDQGHSHGHGHGRRGTIPPIYPQRMVQGTEVGSTSKRKYNHLEPFGFPFSSSSPFSTSTTTSTTTSSRIPNFKLVSDYSTFPPAVSSFASFPLSPVSGPNRTATNGAHDQQQQQKQVVLQREQEGQRRKRQESAIESAWSASNYFTDLFKPQPIIQPSQINHQLPRPMQYALLATDHAHDVVVPSPFRPLNIILPPASSSSSSQRPHSADACPLAAAAVTDDSLPRMPVQDRSEVDWELTFDDLVRWHVSCWFQARSDRTEQTVNDPACQIDALTYLKCMKLIEVCLRS